MTVTSKELYLSAAVLLLFTARPSEAHDIWVTIEPATGGSRALVNYGDPDNQELPVLERLLELAVISPGTKRSLREEPFALRSDRPSPVLVSTTFAAPAQDALIAVTYDGGCWVKTPQGYRNVSRRLVPSAQESFWAAKFSKTLLGPGAYTRSAGHELELIPLSDPYQLSEGQSLRVRVDFRRAPLANAEVGVRDASSAISEANIPRFKTDANGVASVAVLGGRTNVLMIEHKLPGAQQEVAAMDHFSATLVFSLPFRDKHSQR